MCVLPVTEVCTAEFTQALEQEVTELKARCRRLEEQLEGANSPRNTATVTPATTHAPVAPDNAYLQNHIRSLNETIGKERQPRVTRHNKHPWVQVKGASQLSKVVSSPGLLSWSSELM